MSFRVAIVGRPNVGKSTLFNRLVEKRIAITDEKSGTTRDRIFGKCEWLTKTFFVIDTGGIDFDGLPFSELIKKQVDIAIKQADVVLFLCDGKLGINKDDEVISKMLRQKNKDIILVVNKVDGPDIMNNFYDFYSLGFKDTLAISSYHGLGIGELLDLIVSRMKDESVPVPSGVIPFTIIGRQNVGKSSLTNAILNDNRVIVSETPGTTLDSIDTYFEKNGQQYVVIDTAGIVKKAKIDEDIDKYSLIRTVDAIDRADVCLLVIDGSVGVSALDNHVSSYITEASKAAVIVVNKWDLVPKDTNTMVKMEEEIRTHFKYMDYAEIVFISALYKERIDKIFEPILRAYQNYHKEIKTSLINEIIGEASLYNPPKLFNKKVAKFAYGTQIGYCPPKIKIYVNDPLCVHFSYQRYLINYFNKTIDLKGTPLVLLFEKKEDNDEY